MRKNLIYVLAFGMLFSLGACKSKQSAYKSAYERAKEMPVAEAMEEEEPVVKTPSAKHSGAAVQTEKVYAVDNADTDNLKKYSVVVGSFINKTNATALMNEMKGKGFNAFLARNEKDMFRVIIASYPEKAEAAEERDRLKAKYEPRFSDAWILENAN